MDFKKHGRIIVISTIVLFFFFLAYQLRTKITAGQAECKKTVLEEYHRISLPWFRKLSATLKAPPDGNHEFNRLYEEFEQIGRGNIANWWACHIKYMSVEDREKITRQRRWDEYVTLPHLLSDVLEHYTVDDAIDLLTEYGVIRSAAEIRERHSR